MNKSVYDTRSFFSLKIYIVEKGEILWQVNLKKQEQLQIRLV